MRFPSWLQVFGDRSFRGRCPHEETEQMNFFAMLRLHHPDLARLAIHPKNEGNRNWMRQQMDYKKGEVNPGGVRRNNTRMPCDGGRDKASGSHAKQMGE